MTDSLTRAREPNKESLKVAKAFQDRLCGEPCEHNATHLWWASIQFPDELATLLDTAVREAREKEAELRLALERVNDIRNSIIGRQGFNYSQHAYPLVAALGAVGIKGTSYEEARANLPEIDSKILKWQAEINNAEAERLRSLKEGQAI